MKNKTDLPLLKLPRKVEADAKATAVSAVLTQNCEPVWAGSSYKIGHIEFTDAVEKELQRAFQYQQIERGIDRIAQVLESEKKGLDALRARKGDASPNRVSRLLVVTSDGSERFYRACESILANHGDRVLMLQLNVTCDRLAKNVVQTDKQLKAILLSHRDAVSSFLLSLVLQ